MAKKPRQSKPALDSLDGNDRQRIYKRAAKMRKVAQGDRTRDRRKTTREWLEGDSDQLETHQKVTRRSGGSLEEWVDQVLQHDDLVGMDEDSIDENWHSLGLGTVLEVHSGRCKVAADEVAELTMQPAADASAEQQGSILDCKLSAAIAMTQKTDLAVGDRVHLSAPRMRSGDRTDAASVGSEVDIVVDAVQPRRSALSRPDPLRHLERVLVANVDVIVIVAAVKNPPLRPRLIDRFLIAIQRGNIDAAICINKVDLDECAEQTSSTLSPYRDLGIPVFYCSATEGRGTLELREHLRGRTSAFVGHSGVGKSSLLNALAPQLEVRTQEVGVANKGRHTTTCSTLHRLPGQTQIIDTPGIRSFGLTRLDRRQLAFYFPEFDGVASGCHFADCSHDHEPDCQVRCAAQSGRIAPPRYEAYLRILREIDAE